MKTPKPTKKDIKAIEKAIQQGFDESEKFLKSVKNVLNKNVGGKEVVIRSHAGDVIPLFYLPIYSKDNEYVIECWHFLLAPFVLFYRIQKNVFWSIWRDLVTFQRLQKYK